MDLTERRNLRGGRPIWTSDEKRIPRADALPSGTIDVAIIGAGIMGAMLAERLARGGRSVVVLDRRPPAHGSTAASTALIQWAMDVPLTHLAREIGADEAARRWRRIYKAVGDLRERIDAEAIDCSLLDRPELYLEGKLLNADSLREEGEARIAAGLPSRYLAAGAVTERFGIAPAAALTDTAFTLDPVSLTLALLDRARGHGATLCFPADVTGVSGAIELTLADGRTLHAREAILATGYERSRWFVPPEFAVASSFAIATPPMDPFPWREEALIWQASDPYLYVRPTSDGRVLAGGADESFADAARRDARIDAKGGTIAAAVAAMIATQPLLVDHAWAATFGTSPDGLPAIGRAAHHDGLWVAAGFGGNGISFALLASDIICGALDGAPDEDADCFSPYRFKTP
jgi:glycine/D-amino acid oxidase-like deaminating enzyme